jgi:hypothetical protein
MRRRSLGHTETTLNLDLPIDLERVASWRGRAILSVVSNDCSSTVSHHEYCYDVSTPTGYGFEFFVRSRNFSKADSRNRVRPRPLTK